MIRLFGFIAAMLLLAAAAPATAQPCSNGAVLASQIGLDQYDPASAVNPVMQLSLRLTDSGCRPLTVALTPQVESSFLVRGPGGILISRRVPSTAVEVNNPVRTILNRESVQTLAGGGTVTFDFLEFASGQFVQAGRYELVLDVNVNGRTSTTITLVIDVAPALQILGDASVGTIELDLGNVDGGGIGRKSIFYRSNTRLSLDILSDHGGRMRHSLGEQFGYLPYTLRVDGQIARPTPSASVPLGTPGGRPGLNEVSLLVTTPPAREAFSGRYVDVLTFSFTAD
ncbi:hypothetical protein ACPVPU_05020 [Sphingomonas sp. CJ99]